MTWDYNYGEPFTEETEKEILEALKPDYISGLTLIGGEPFEPSNQRALLPFVKKVKAEYPEKTVWCYTGFVFDKEILGDSRARCEVTDELLGLIDVLVDGRFVESQKNISLKFRGSSNQRIIDLKKSLASKDKQVILLKI